MLNGRHKETNEALNSVTCAKELKRIFDYFHMQTLEIPKEITDTEQVMQFVMNETGLMRRKVVLTGKWWKCGAAPLLVSNKNANPISLIPDCLFRFFRISDILWLFGVSLFAGLIGMIMPSIN